MFGFPRLGRLVGEHPGGAELIPHLLEQLDDFTGANWEQEDDVTLVTLQCTRLSAAPQQPTPQGAHRKLAEFSVASEEGNERVAVARLEEALGKVELEGQRLERLKTAVAEATMNAMEHGNKYQADLPVSVTVLAAPTELLVRVTDLGGGGPFANVEIPDLEAKLEGTQSPRGWDLYLMKSLVDDLRVESDDTHHTVELVVSLTPDSDGV